MTLHANNEEHLSKRRRRTGNTLKVKELMQSEGSGQLTGTSPARDDVTHHYSSLNAIKAGGNQEQTKKRATKVGRGEEGQWINHAEGRRALLCG